LKDCQVCVLFFSTEKRTINVDQRSGDKSLKKLWYVDDDSEMIQAVKLMLKLLDYETKSFHSVREAAKLMLAGEQPDVLLLDINMPEVTGLDMLEFVRRRDRWQNLPIVMLSSEADDMHVDKALELGADSYIFKPVTIEELEVALKKAEDKRRNYLDR
jgi:DNA-binding response OmpR family regulator